MTDRCPSIQEIEDRINAELRKEGLEPVEFAREFQKITNTPIEVITNGYDSIDEFKPNLDAIGNSSFQYPTG